MNLGPLRLVFFATAVFSSPLFADESTDMLNKALDLVHEASAQPTDPQATQWLTQAIDLTRNVPLHRLQGHRVQAVQDMRSALAALRSGDANHQAAGYLQGALTELNASLTLAHAAESISAPVVAPPPPASTTPAPPPVPPVPVASAPATNAPAALPPGVTPEMEQAFLAKFNSAINGQNLDAPLALFANDPKLDPKALEHWQGLEMFSLALTASNPNRTYSFVSPPAEQKEDEDTAFQGKMYGSYLPTVAGLKITFGPPPKSSSNQMTATGENVLSLCVQNQQLMLVGFKEIPDAATPPEKPFDKASNFGLTPNLHKSDSFKDPFISLDDFLSALKQPALEIIASGKTDFEYYAICRAKPDLLIWAGHSLPGHHNYGWYIEPTDDHQQPLKGEQSWVRLVDMPTDDKPAPLVQGTVFHIPPGCVGPVIVKANYTDDVGKKAPSFSRTVELK